MLSYSDILEIKNQYVLLQKIPRRSLFLLFFLPGGFSGSGNSNPKASKAFSC